MTHTVGEYVIELATSMYLADFISGLVHLRIDYQTVHNRSLRLHVEPTIPDILTFRESRVFKDAKKRDQFLWNFHAHHDVPYPSADTFVELFLQIARPLSVPTLMIVVCMCCDWLQLWAGRVMLTACFLGSVTQFTHFAAHMRSRGLVSNRLVLMLQDMHLILHPDTHSVHHEKFDRNFCILNGWANPVVNRIRRLGTRLGFFWKEPPTVMARRERALLALKSRE